MNMKHFKRQLVLSVAVIGGVIASPALGQDAYPERPITMVVPYGAGGGTDLATRILAEAMGPILGQPVVVENEAGGGGAVALGRVFAADPDGYTIAVGTASNTSIIPFSTEVAYDPLGFTYVASFFGWPYVMVIHPSIPATTLSELIDWAKANPRGLVAATTGGFNIHEIGIGLLAQETGGFEYRTLPTNSAAEGTARVLAGDANFATGSPVTYAEHIRAGTLTPLAVVSDVSTDDLDALGVPMLRDELGFELVNTTVVIAPPGMDEAIRQELEDAVRQALEDPAVIAQINALDFPVQFAPGAEALEVTRGLQDLYRPIVERLLESRG